MTHLDVYRCDRKRCQAEKPAAYQTGTSELIIGPLPPTGWLLLEPQGATFCSLDCLAIWARAERVAREGT